MELLIQLIESCERPADECAFIITFADLVATLAVFRADCEPPYQGMHCPYCWTGGIWLVLAGIDDGSTYSVVVRRAANFVGWD